MVFGCPKTYAKKVVTKCKIVTAKSELAQEETQNYPKHPPGGREANVLGRPKTIILPFLGFGLSRGHGLYKSL